MCTVLIVDDHQDSRETIAELVREKGHSHQEVSNGKEALEWLRDQAEVPCLILLDLRMPVMDGWDFMNALHQDARLANIPVIVLSATVRPRDPTPVLRAKAFWSKPPDADHLSRVHEYCALHRHSWPEPRAS